MQGYMTPISHPYIAAIMAKHKIIGWQASINISWKLKHSGGR
jgi:hypothetical protein